jgi:hypothetical protein
MSKKKSKGFKKYGFFSKVLEDNIGAYLYNNKKLRIKWRNW